MILTYKVRHNSNFDSELQKAKLIAEFAIKNKTLSSSTVKHFGLKSMISNQILRKYGKNKRIKHVHSVNLIIPNQGINFKNNKISIPCLNLILDFNKPCAKINQIELNKEYAFVSVTISENNLIIPDQWLGVDLNTTGYCTVVANETTGKVLKLGKKAHHTHLKYKNQRKHLQKSRCYKLVKKIKNKESKIVRDLNHKISRRIVDEAVKQNAGIVLEDLTGIRGTKKQTKSFKYSLNSWSFFQLRQFIEYKANLLEDILLTISSNVEEQSKFKQAVEQKIQDIKKKSKEGKGKVEVVKASIDDQEKGKELRPLQAPLSTRSCPDHPGVSLVRISDGLFYCPLNGKQYDYNSGYVTEKGNRVPGTSVKNQNDQLNDLAMSTMFFDK